MPECDLCFVQKVRRLARADAKIPGTCWWYLCQEHFDHYRCAIGNGKGYLLEERASDPLI